MEEKQQNSTEETVPVTPKEVAFVADGNQYVLGFDRASVAQAESAYGISFGELTTGKTYIVENLFHAAFIKNHPQEKPETISSLWTRLKGKGELYNALVRMYVDTAASVLEEPDEGNAISWTTL